MPDASRGGTVRRVVVFLAGSVVAGLLLAAAIAVLWPAAAAAAGTLPPCTSNPLPKRRSYTAGERDPQPTPAPCARYRPAATPSQPAPLMSFAPAVRASAPAVVNIYTQRTVTERVPGIDLEQFLGGTVRPRYRERVQSGLGSGVIVDRNGHIVTNQHVIEGFDEISVQLADGRSAAAKVVGRDPDTDIAVLKIDLPRLPVMTLGRSDRIEVGDVVLAIGNPLGLTQTVTHGIVSATGRAQLGVATFENFIQTDAAINVGNSGGALVNLRGELVGINTAVLGKNLGAEGIGVAIPVDLVRGVMSELLEHGRVIRGWIGILPEDISAQHVQAAEPAARGRRDQQHLSEVPRARCGHHARRHDRDHRRPRGAQCAGHARADREPQARIGDHDRGDAGAAEVLRQGARDRGTVVTR